jgi:SAM-dependent methyltransferase
VPVAGHLDLRAVDFTGDRLSRGVPELLHAQMDAGASVLDLGAGTGRLAHGLVALGHPVTAVDESPEMLARVHDCETVLADVYALDLRLRFDAVVASSHLVNDWPEALLRTCARHVVPDGVVLVQRYAPDWAEAPEAGESHVGEVLIRVEPHDAPPGRLSFDVTYELAGEQWHQSVDALVLDDAALAEHASRVGLRLIGTFDEFGEWVMLAPVEPEPPRRPEAAPKRRPRGLIRRPR